MAEMTMQLVPMTFREFIISRNCGNPIETRENFWVFADGSTSDGKLNSNRPPEDLYERLRLKIEYNSALLRRLEKSYGAAVSALHEDFGNSAKSISCPPPMANWEEELAKAAKQIQFLRGRIARLRAREQFGRQPSPADEHAAMRKRAADIAMTKLTRLGLNYEAHVD